MVRSWLEKLFSETRLFLHAEEGMTLPLLALAFFALTGLTGLAIDVGRVQMVQSKLQFSMDAAGLAAGATVSTANATEEFKKYLDVNFGHYMGADITSTSVTMNDTKTVFTLAASAKVPTTFMRIFGVNDVTFSVNSEITRAVTGLELVLVLDNTGSMRYSTGAGESKLQALKTASETLINTLFESADAVTNGKLWVSVVPFSQAVNIGTAYASWINPDYVYDSTTDTSATLDWGTTSWGGCVDSRLNGEDITDTPPSSESTLFGMYYWTSDNFNTNDYARGNNNWKFYRQCRENYRRCYYFYCYTVTGSCTEGGGYTCTDLGTETCTNVASCTAPYNSCTLTYASPLNTTDQGPNLYCPETVTTMTNQKATLLSALESMVAKGNTEINAGLAWGWRLLSPRWQGLWGGLMNANGLPLDYKTPGMAKAVVLLTDGENTISNYAHGSYWYYGSDRLGGMSLDEKTLALCSAMKNAGIYVYTIGLGPSYDINEALLKECATADNYFFLSPTTDELQNVFYTIGDSLSNLRVSQ
ncbi:MAG: pilus assembly protein TadG-related protein [Alphaproteobacteria bacterium]|nr:pilus assembly protein TadG-related protein [Alphaproteobacteria bacterium]